MLCYNIIVVEGRLYFMKVDIFFSFKDFIKEHKKELLILFSIFLFGIYTIIRANVNYKDDLGRVAFGYQGWQDFSRYLSCLLSNFIHADSYLTDVSPLPQVFGTFILALSGLMTLSLLSKKKNYSIYELFALVPLGLSPYFLECISYKYDAPYMALSILFSIFPLLFHKYKKYIYIIMCFISSLIVCTTYQASSGIFPMFVILLSLILWNKKSELKKIIEFIVLSIIGYCGGLLLFKGFLTMPYTTDYVSYDIPKSGKIFYETLSHLKIYYNCIINDFKPEWLLFIGLICIGFIYVMIRDSKQKKLHSLFISTISLVLMLLICFGAYPLLSQPLYAPRSMYGFGVFIALIGIVIILSKNVYFFKIIYIALCWSFFVFSFTYGNALASQKEYSNFRIESVLNDLKDLDVITDETITNIQITGSIGNAPNIRNMPQSCDILNKLMPITFGDSSYSYAYFQLAYYYNLKNLRWSHTFDFTSYDLPILKDNYYHTIKGNDKYILIILK